VQNYSSSGQLRVQLDVAMRPCSSLFCVALLSALGFVAPARAGETIPDPKGFYATLGLGASWPQTIQGDITGFGVPVKGSYGMAGGFAGEIGAGYDFGTVRAELTYTYNNATITTGTISVLGLSGSTNINNGGVNTNSVMASAYVDIPTKSRWVPYVGGGIGYTNVGWGAYSATVGAFTATEAAGNQGVFGYQAKVGLSYLAAKNADVFVEGTYQGTTGFTVDTVNYDPISSWGARLGARYRF
jgi:opacity protein-like surface antigen